jgi:hypothetical protein
LHYQREEYVPTRYTLSIGLVTGMQESEMETLIGLLNEGRLVHISVAILTPSLDL